MDTEKTTVDTPKNNDYVKALTTEPDSVLSDTEKLQMLADSYIESDGNYGGSHIHQISSGLAYACKLPGIRTSLESNEEYVQIHIPYQIIKLDDQISVSFDGFALRPNSIESQEFVLFDGEVTFIIEGENGKKTITLGHHDSMGSHNPYINIDSQKVSPEEAKAIAGWAMQQVVKMPAAVEAKLKELEDVEKQLEEKCRQNRKSFEAVISELDLPL